jgi:hypothetical protein
MILKAVMLKQIHGLTAASMLQPTMAARPLCQRSCRTNFGEIRVRAWLTSRFHCVGLHLSRRDSPRQKQIDVRMLLGMLGTHPEYVRFYIQAMHRRRLEYREANHLLISILNQADSCTILSSTVINKIKRGS